MGSGTLSARACLVLLSLHILSFPYFSVSSSPFLPLPLSSLPLTAQPLPDDTNQHKQPELLRGDRYNEKVDVYSLSIVMYEIAMRELPFAKHIRERKEKGGKGLDRELMQGIANVKRVPVLDKKACERYRVGWSFQKCTCYVVFFCFLFLPLSLSLSFPPSLSLSYKSRISPSPSPRPRLPPPFHAPFHTPHAITVFDRCSCSAPWGCRASIETVARKLEEMCREPEVKLRDVTKITVENPWKEGNEVERAMREFADTRMDFIDCSEEVTQDERLEEVYQQLKSILGSRELNAVSGVYNSPRVYRFLLVNKYDAPDTVKMIQLNWDARVELEMDQKRSRIVREDLGFGTLPGAAEFQKFVPNVSLREQSDWGWGSGGGGDNAQN